MNARSYGNFGAKLVYQAHLRSRYRSSSLIVKQIHDGSTRVGYTFDPTSFFKTGQQVLNKYAIKGVISNLNTTLRKVGNELRMPCLEL